MSNPAPSLTSQTTSAEDAELIALAMADAGLDPTSVLAAAKEAEAAKAELAIVRAELLKQSQMIRLNALRQSCVDTFVGTGQSATADPGSPIDITLGTSPAQLLANLKARFGTSTEPFSTGTAVALLPVILWPTAMIDAKRPTQSLQTPDGKPIPQYQVGRTFFNQSTAIASITLPDGTKRDISLTGMASLGVAMNINTGTMAHPDDVAKRIDKFIARSHFQTLCTNPSKLGDAEDTGDSVFIPSTANAPDPSQAAALAHQSEQSRIASRMARASASSATPTT